MKPELNIPINVKIDVDTATANICLGLVENYLNEHAGKTIKIVNKEDGSVKLLFWSAQSAQNAGEPATDPSAGYAASCC
ncbi:MAG: hypothetical protein LUG44_01145 [Clostridiales bacterium]|nr:hypothetical protein [Clostridiales bacterium]